MKIYTKTGDKGETSYYLGSDRVKKNDIRIEVFGAIDELNSSIGLAISFVDDSEIKMILEKVQNDLFTLAAELAAYTANVKIPTPKIDSALIRGLEDHIDSIEPLLKIPSSFVLPGGTKASSFLHLARTTCRRVERLIITMNDSISVNGQTIQYINRLSDLLYMLARKANKELVKEQQPIYKYFEERSVDE